MFYIHLKKILIPCLLNQFVKVLKGNNLNNVIPIIYRSTYLLNHVINSNIFNHQLCLYLKYKYLYEQQHTEV